MSILQKELPPFMKAKDLYRTGLIPMSEARFYEFLNREGCPVIRNGRALIVITERFLKWFEEQAVS
jgi:hypothetical protein